MVGRRRSWLAVAHVVGVVGADDDVAGGGGAEQRAQDLVAVDEVVEVEQLEVVAGGPVDDQAGFGARLPAVVPAANDGLGDAAPVGEADFEVGIARKGAPEDEGGRADAGLDGEADEVGGVIAAQAVGAGGGGGVDEKQDVEFGGTPEERVEFGLVVVAAVDAGADLDGGEAILAHDAVEFVDRGADVLEGDGAHGDEAVGVCAASVVDGVVADGGDFGAEGGFGEVVEEAGHDGEGGLVEGHAIHLLEADGEVEEARIEDAGEAAGAGPGGGIGAPGDEGVEAAGVVMEDDGLVAGALGADDVDQALGDVVVVDVDEHGVAGDGCGVPTVDVERWSSGGSPNGR